MKGKIINILLILIFVAGLSLLLYPTISDYYNSYLQSNVIVEYSNQVEAMEASVYEKHVESANAYNATLLERTNPFMLTPEQEELYWQLLATSDKGVMAYVEIPAISVTLPIAHGTEEDTLKNYVGHMEWSSLPVGGESTHCVISGHRGLPSSELFTNIDHLEIGDYFYIHVLGQILEYRVDNIAVVDPYDYTLLGIQQGYDYTTLVTCTPYGINSHRLLVRGVRSGTVQTHTEGLQIKNEVTSIDTMVIVPIVLVVLSVLIFLGMMLNSSRKKTKERGGDAHGKE